MDHCVFAGGVEDRAISHRAPDRVVYHNHKSQEAPALWCPAQEHEALLQPFLQVEKTRCIRIGGKQRRKPRCSAPVLQLIGS
ncbi:hypothetical protein SKAU_G00251260 [Synaphobranchus kaupii]|uniref:Uncharacterized protein n=1 Tax=Synaphobranchus kaupii TaxID=118154 RepID=A0A9Q1F308_SYNKA|nr:hypothetical protein SKAU_G00251260 [Synaphobranchus kaupii]